MFNRFADEYPILYGKIDLIFYYSIWKSLETLHNCGTTIFSTFEQNVYEPQSASSTQILILLSQLISKHIEQKWKLSWFVCKRWTW